MALAERGGWGKCLRTFGERKSPHPNLPRKRGRGSAPAILAAQPKYSTNNPAIYEMASRPHPPYNGAFPD